MYKRQGKVKEKEYRHYREALVNLAAEEMSDDGGEKQAPATTGHVAVLSPEARDLVRRIDELDAKSRSDANAIAERAHLLEALAKALPREGKRK